MRVEPKSRDQGRCKSDALLPTDNTNFYSLWFDWRRNRPASIFSVPIALSTQPRLSDECAIEILLVCRSTLELDISRVFLEKT